MSLKDKVALIPGGSRGIGAATVRLFRQAGAKVVFSYLSAAPQAEALVQECGGPVDAGSCAPILAPTRRRRALAASGRPNGIPKRG